MRLFTQRLSVLAVLTLSAHLSALGGALLGLCCAADAHVAAAAGDAAHVCAMHAAPRAATAPAHHAHGGMTHEAHVESPESSEARIRCNCSPSLNANALVGIAGLLSSPFDLPAPTDSALATGTPGTLPIRLAHLPIGPPPRR